MNSFELVDEMVRVGCQCDAMTGYSCNIHKLAAQLVANIKEKNKVCDMFSDQYINAREALKL